MSKTALVRARLAAVPGDRFTAMIDEGIRDADAGRLIPHADVVAWVRSWGQPDELPMPELASGV